MEGSGESVTRATLSPYCASCTSDGIVRFLCGNMSSKCESHGTVLLVLLTPGVSSTDLILHVSSYK